MACFHQWRSVLDFFLWNHNGLRKDLKILLHRWWTYIILNLVSCFVGFIFTCLCYVSWASMFTLLIKKFFLLFDFELAVSLWLSSFLICIICEGKQGVEFFQKYSKIGEGLEKVIVGCKKCKCNFIKCKMTSPIIKHSRAATLGTKNNTESVGRF